METYVLAVQARCLQWIGLLALCYGIICGYDPLFVAWRAALAALLGMIFVGFFLRKAVRLLMDQVRAEELAADEPTEPGEEATV